MNAFTDVSERRMVAVDPGFGNVKMACLSEGIKVAIVPSVVGVGQTDVGLLSVGFRRRQGVPDEVRFPDGTAYLVGENVPRYARPIQRLDFGRLADGPELRALFYSALYRLLGEGTFSISLLVGLPVEVMADRERALGTLRTLKGWVVGTHRFAVNGHSLEVQVTGVRALAQPAGAYFAWGLDDRGRWVRGQAMKDAPVAVCDIGFNTLDLFAVQGGEVVGRFTGGDTAGVRRAAERLIGVVKARYGVDLSLPEADGLLRAERPVLGGGEDLRPVVRQALQQAAAEIITFVEGRWGNGRQFATVLFCGGGAALLREELLRQYPHGVVLPDPVTANAVGLARYAVRAGW